jgi:rod shape-determining protein MreC
MIQFLQQKKATLVLVALVSLMLVLMSHDVGGRGGTDMAGEILFKAGAPAVRAGSSVTGAVGDVFKNYADLRGVRAENEKLSESLLRTELERDALREQASEGERLQALFDMRKALPSPGVAAHVVASGLASGAATLLIDRGTVDGVLPGMPVVGVGGVVGRILLASPTLSKVLCITDPRSGVGVTMQQSGFHAVLEGTTAGSCAVNYLPPYAEIATGDLVVTSGLDRIYPKGISVGRIVGRPEGQGLQRRFEVRPTVDFTRLSEVLVLKVPPPEREPPEAATAPPPLPAAPRAKGPRAAVSPGAAATSPAGAVEAPR